MNRFVIEFSDRINELYKTYESYIWRGDNRKLAIVFQYNMTISFYLYENKNLIDELHLSFDKKEYDLYKTMCLRTFVIALGNVLVHKLDGENAYYNNKHRPYLVVVSKDDNVSSLIDSMVYNQENEIIDFNTTIIKNADNLVKKRKLYSNEFLNKLDTRVKISHEMLRRR